MENVTDIDSIVDHIKQNARKGDPESVLKVADDFCSKNARRSMHIGPKKGSIVDDIFREHKPKIALELGAYWGYSAVRYGRLMEPGTKYFSIEFSPRFLQVAKDLVEFAGLSDVVTFIEGSSEDVIPRLKKDYNIDSVDLVFIDHDKTLYKPDVIRLDECGLLKKGSVMAADNVLCPGAPDYLEYVRSSPKFISTFYESSLNYRPEIKDGIEKSVYL